MTPERPEGLPDVFTWDTYRLIWWARVARKTVEVSPLADGGVHVSVGNLDLRAPTFAEAVLGHAAIRDRWVARHTELARALRALVEPEPASGDRVREILDSWGIYDDGPYAELCELLTPDLAAEVERLTRERDEARAEVGHLRTALTGSFKAKADRDAMSRTLGQVIRDTAKDLGCKPDNEAILVAIDGLQKAERQRDALREALEKFIDRMADLNVRVDDFYRDTMFEDIDAARAALASEVAGEPERPWAVGDECVVDGVATGWVSNRAEGRVPCVCLTETEAWQALEARAEKAERARDEARAEVVRLRGFLIGAFTAARETGSWESVPKIMSKWKSRAETAERERDALREAVRGLLLSADAAWEERGEGHDWREACEAARAIFNRADEVQS